MDADHLRRFITRCVETDLVAPATLERVLPEIAAAGEGTTVLTLCEALVRRRLLTRSQARRLLAGFPEASAAPPPVDPGPGVRKAAPPSLERKNAAEAMNGRGRGTRRGWWTTIGVVVASLSVAVGPYLLKNYSRVRRAIEEATSGSHSPAPSRAPAAVAAAECARSRERLAAGDFSAARRHAELAIRGDPTGADGWHCRGLARERLGQRAGAESDFRRALSLAPKNWDRRREAAAAIARVRP
ncbi:MAG: tetratricopeptide repeat protein [Planctomycetes bacterium]|nr:tetratricopeptide repeat protein [Planctomycetota bacterium]